MDDRGTAFMGTYLLGLIGLPLFLYGMYLSRKAQQEGLTVRPLLVTLIGYLVILDGFLNTVGWALDFIANHSLLNRVSSPPGATTPTTAPTWQYNELYVGGASAPGEKGWRQSESSSCSRCGWPPPSPSCR